MIARNGQNGHAAPAQKRPPVRQPGPRAAPTAPIVVGEIYTADEFLRRVGWKNAAFTAARKAGLKCVVAGGRRWVRGSWFAEYLEMLAATNRPP
jgi:hypothetical protein